MGRWEPNPDAEAQKKTIEQLKANLKDKNTEIDNLKKEIAQIKHNYAAYDSPEKIIEVQNDLSAREQELNQWEQELSAKDQKLSAREAVATKNELRNNERQQMLLDMEHQNKETTQSLRFKERSLEDRESSCSIREAELQQKENAVYEREQKLAAKENTLDNDLEAKRSLAEQTLKEEEAKHKQALKQKLKEQRTAQEQRLAEEEAAHESKLRELEAAKRQELDELKKKKQEEWQQQESARQAELEKLQEETKKYQDLSKICEDKTANLEAEYQQKNADLDMEYQQKNAALDMEYQQKKAALDIEYQQKNAALETEHTAKLNTLELNYAAKQEQLDWDRRLYEAKSEKLNEAMQNLDDKMYERYRQELDNKDALLADKEEALENANAEILRLSVNSAALKSFEVLYKDKTPKAILKEISTYKQQVEELKEDLVKRPPESLTEEYNKLLEAHDAQKKELAAKNQELLELYQDKQEISVLKANLEYLEENMRGKDRLIEVKTAEVNNLQAEIDRLYRPGVSENIKDQCLETIMDSNVIPDKYTNPERGEKLDELKWLKNISENCAKCGISFPKRILYAFHTSLKISDWSIMTVLAGISGTGKTELPRLYSIMGRLLFINVPVQPNWDSQESMLGYFNSIDNRFEAQPVLSFLVKAEKKYPNCMGIVLLDEMNLAHVEQYFAEFLSKLEQRRGKSHKLSPTIDIKLGAKGGKLDLGLSRNILWCGTMNQDETTKALSDKVLDRGIVINFPRPKTLKSRPRMDNLDEFERDNFQDKKVPMLHRNTWLSWVKWDTSAFTGEQAEKLEEYRQLTETISNYMSTVGRAIGHRVWQSIEYYIANYPEVIQQLSKAPEGQLTRELEAKMKIAYEDQLVQKIMPKLRGVEINSETNKYCFDKIEKLLDERQFAIKGDFQKARTLGYGQFQWCSADYIDDILAHEEKSSQK